MLEPASPRLFLIDGYALIYRAFYALISRPLTTVRGENTSAVWGIANFLQRLMKTHQPEYIGWIHDSGTSFRKDTYPAYKATREKLTSELQADFDTGLERIKQLLDAYDIPIIALNGYEADDIIGTLARKAVEQKLNTIVVSGDKDFQQLVRDGIWLLNPGRGGPAAVEEHWVSVENAGERLGVHPRNVTDYLALIGDSSDNVPGVSGIGDKTARELIEQYGDLEQIIANASNITKKRPREALLANIENARLSKRLVTIHEDLDIALDPEKMRLGTPDVRRLRELYVELEFHTLTRDLADEEGESGTVGELNGKEVVYTTIDTTEKLASLVRRARSARVFAIDIAASSETTIADAVNPLLLPLVGISIAVAPGEAYYLPFAHGEERVVQGELGDFGFAPTAAPKSGTRSQPKRATSGSAGNDNTSTTNLPSLSSPELAELRALLEDASVRKLSQNAKYNLLILRREGISLRGIEADTMIASYVLDPGRRSHGLELLAFETLGIKMQSLDQLLGKGRDAVTLRSTSIAAATSFFAEQSDMTLRIASLLDTQLLERNLDPLFREIEMPLIHVLSEMEWNGISIDMDWFRSLKDRFLRERDRVTREIYALAGTEFNINSNNQLREILFGKLGLPVQKRTATGPSTDASVLQQFADQGEPLPALLLEYRELSKLESTYIDALPALVNPATGRLHTSFNQAVASTGRLSSSDPNLQNIPIRRELGRDIRRGFVPRRGWLLMAADYSQIELRLLAHMSNDPAFVTAFRSGGDIHRQTASVIFGPAPEDVTSEMRARAKTINFATIYGQGPHALSQQLGISQAEAKLFIATYFERFRGIREYLDSRIAFAREHGFVETIFGRRRYIPELRDRNFNIRAFGERTAANSPIQGSAADLIKIAMIKVHRSIQDANLKSRMLLQVHDELVFEIAPGEEQQMREVVRNAMEHAAELAVPLVVDIGVGDNWVSAKSGS